MMRALLGVLLLVLVATPSVARAAGEAPRARQARAAAHQRALEAFGPFDAGVARDVVRQGTKGKARRAHPALGDVAKVPGDGPAPPPLRSPLDVPEAGLVNPNALTGSGLSSSPLSLAALGYQYVFTKLDGPRCAHLPTCSRFGSQAVARHGLLGIPMALDRLIQPHESSAIRHLPEVTGWGMIRVYDPLENYQFWRSERFTGFLLPAAEEPLALPPLTKPSPTTSPTTSPVTPETNTP